MPFTTNIPDGFPNLYDDQWRIEMQQLESRLAPFVNAFPLNAEGKRFQRLPKVEARQITTRHGETNPDDIGTEYRWLYPNFKDSAHILDELEVKQLGSVGSPHEQILKTEKVYYFAGQGRIPKVMFNNARIEGTIQEHDFYQLLEGKDGLGVKPVR